MITEQKQEIEYEQITIKVPKIVMDFMRKTETDPLEDALPFRIVDGVRAQIESAVVYGLTATLKSAITVEENKVQQSNFHDFPILSMQEAPLVETHIIDSTRPPGGVGEPGLPPIAPAVANAVFAATGQRLRRLPLRLASSSQTG